MALSITKSRLYGRILARSARRTLGRSEPGREAVEIFRSRKADIQIAFLDVVMPKQGGKEAFEAMRAENPDLKVIFTSGYSAGAIHESFVIKAGIPFLGKPYSPLALARKLREVLDESPEVSTN